MPTLVVGLDFGYGSLGESKICHYIMVEADSHLKLLSASILDIYKEFEHIDMLSMICRKQIPTLIVSDLGVQVTCGVKMMSIHHC